MKGQIFPPLISCREYFYSEFLLRKQELLLIVSKLLLIRERDMKTEEKIILLVKCDNSQLDIFLDNQTVYKYFFSKSNILLKSKKQYLITLNFVKAAFEKNY